MHIDSSVIFSLLGAVVSLGGLCVGFGILKGKVEHAVEENREQAEHLKICATKQEVTALFNQAEDARKRNSDSIARLFDMVNSQAKEIGELNATLKAMKESLDALKTQIQDGLKEIRDEIKDLRKEPKTRRGA
jgi:DNA anti-recombination protein RmuC